MRLNDSLCPDPAERFVPPDPVPRSEGERIAPWQVRAAIAQMQADLTETVNLSALAASVGVSVFHFSRGFRNATGEPPLRHLARLRIREACRLLATTDRPVAAIARAVGYRSPQAFARAFERMCGCTPRDHRARTARDPSISPCCDDGLASAGG